MRTAAFRSLGALALIVVISLTALMPTRAQWWCAGQGRVHDFSCCSLVVVEILDDLSCSDFCVIRLAQQWDRAKIALSQRPSYERFCSYLM